MSIPSGSTKLWARTLAGAAVAVLLSGGGRWAAADENSPCTPAKDAPKKSAAIPVRGGSEKPAVSPTGAPGQAGLKAFIDPSTGRLREPTPEESAAAERVTRFARSGVTVEPKAVTHPNGMASVELGEEYMNDVIVRKGPDGKLSTVCVPRSQREKTLQEPAPPVRTELEKE